jgi:hypothetical protein
LEISGLVNEIEFHQHEHDTNKFNLGESPWCPLDRRLGGPQSWSGHGDEEKNSQPLIIQPIAQLCTTVANLILHSFIQYTKPGIK